MFRLMQQVCAQLFFSHRKWGAVFYKIKKSLENFRLQGIFYVREKIRTPDTLVRSQVLYPAELHTHNKCSLRNVYNLTPVSGICQEIF